VCGRGAWIATKNPPRRLKGELGESCDLANPRPGAPRIGARQENNDATTRRSRRLR
jgi:hypothetical protein